MPEPTEAGRTAPALTWPTAASGSTGHLEEPTGTERRVPHPAAHLMNRLADSPAGRPGRPLRPR
jgi:hypothetical protein